MTTSRATTFTVTRNTVNAMSMMYTCIKRLQLINSWALQFDSGVISIISHDSGVISIISHDSGVISIISHDSRAISIISHDSGAISIISYDSGTISHDSDFVCIQRLLL